jgi:thiol-disulfide isomerase/thioredoxin
MKNALFTTLLVLFLITLGISANAQTRLNSLNGGTVDVRGQRGKVVVLAVGASWLPLSSKQAEFTNALAKKYAGKNVVFYFVATDSANPKSKNYATDEKLRQWAAANNLAVEVLRDPDGEAVTRAFTIDQLPAFVILDKEGKQSGDAFGGIDPKFDITVPISKKIDSLL